jgi:hypothetical protein
VENKIILYQKITGSKEPKLENKLIKNTSVSHSGDRGFFLIRIVGGGVQLGPLGTSATNWPIVFATG